jgi:hypothetical protein
MDELTAIRQLLAPPPPPAPDVVAAAQARLERAARGSGARGQRAPGRRGRPSRPGRLAVAAALAAAVAAGAGLIATQVIGAGGATPAATLTVHELAYRVAAAAERQPQVRPSQWVYWKEATASTPASTFHSTFQVWTTADATKAAFIARGKLHFIDAPHRGAWQTQIVGQPNASGGVLITHIPITYPGLSSLPRRPQALLRYLTKALPYPSYGPTPIRDFATIEELVTTYVMPPSLTAELYRALGDIPGVTVNDHAEDVAGRQGVGFLSPSQLGANMELIFDSRTYRLMGNDLLVGPSHRPVSGTAILREALVSGPGAAPPSG